jgi:hypothetical protein
MASFKNPQKSLSGIAGYPHLPVPLASASSGASQGGGAQRLPTSHLFFVITGFSTLACGAF